MTNKQKNISSTAPEAHKGVIKVLNLNFTSHKIPEIKEVKNKKYIYFGNQNDYPNYLLNLYNRSAKHNALINAKAHYIAGAGFENGDIKVNAEDETWNDIIYKITLDTELFGGFYLEIIWGKANGKIAEIRHINFNDIRSNEDNTEFYFTTKWLKDYGLGVTYPNSQVEQEDDWQVYQVYNPKKSGKQLYFFKSYRPGIKTYPLPDYLGATAYIELDYQIANFWYNSVKFGFSASHIINFYNGVPTETEQKKLEKSIQDKLTGTDNAGLFILNFADSKERGTEIQTIPQQDLDKQFQILNKTVQQEIFSGHRITSPMLFGIKTEGQLGGRTELLEANELFNNSYVKPKQKQLESALMPLFENMGLKEMKLKSIQPIGLDVLDDKLFNLLTDDEKRQLAGKEPLPIRVKPKESDVVTIINSLPPLVANKVLNSLSQDEIREIVGLLPLPPGTITPQPTEIENKASSLFKKYAQDLKGKILKSKPLKEDEIDKLEETEDRFKIEGFVAKNIYINTKDRAILDLIDKDPLMPIAEISKALKISTEDIKKSIENLIKDKFLTRKDKELILTSSAKSFLKDLPAPTEKIFVMYSYEWIEGFSDDDIEDSREFCVELRKMTKQGKLWSREDIEKIGNEAGWDVWRMRGGWYTKPGTDIHLPYCRHIWTQNLIQQ